MADNAKPNEHRDKTNKYEIHLKKLAIKIVNTTQVRCDSNIGIWVGDKIVNSIKHDYTLAIYTPL